MSSLVSSYLQVMPERLGFPHRSVSEGVSLPLAAQGDVLRHLCSGQSNEPSVTPNIF